MNLGEVIDRIDASISASSESVCAGETIDLLASASGTVTYAWSGDGLVTTTGETVMATPTVTTDYTVVASALGCTSSATISINVNEAPAVAGSSTIAWSGLTNGTATATVTGGLAPYTYLWDDPNAQTAETAIGLDLVLIWLLLPMQMDVAQLQLYQLTKLQLDWIRFLTT